MLRSLRHHGRSRSPSRDVSHRIASIVFVALLAGSTATSAGCGPSKAEEEAARAAAEAEDDKKKTEAIARLSPAVRRKVAQVDKLREELFSMPVAAPDAAPPAASPPIKLKGLHYDDPDSNADVMFRFELTLLQRGVLGSCNYHLRRNGEDLTSYEADKFLTGCTKVRYFLVVRPARKVSAKEEGGSNYSGGEITGDVVVFELPDEGDPKALGAFPIDVKLTRKVEVRMDADKDGVEYELNEALREELYKAIEKKIGGAKPPQGW